jgi:predicted ATPase/DNA-binding SARP family transcriptional activator
VEALAARSARKGYNRAVEFRILGPLEVYEHGRPLALGAQKQRDVLGVLLVHAGEVVSTRRLIDELWADRPPASAAKLVQGYVSGLRKVLGAPVIVTRDSGYVLQLGAGQLDAREFEQLVGEARGLAPAAAADKLREALALWRGPALVERLDEQRTEALMARIDADLACGRHAEVVAELETLVGEHPLRERPRGQLMLALYRSGRQAEALAEYREARRLLTDELGLDPGPELQALEKAILNQDSALAAPAASRPETPTNLPQPATPLIGREQEVSEAGALLRARRLLTLTGPGGSGKTRLALELAREATGEFADGVFWVPLQAVVDVDAVLPAIAIAVDARETREDEPLGALREFLRGRELLLVLDNFEQVVDAATRVAELLSWAPRVTVLVTSRKPLRLSREQRWHVDPLPEDDARALFLARARAIDPAFVDVPEVVEICRRLDGLPLALELAAARTALLSPPALLARLEQRLPTLVGGPRDAPERQRTLRATIGWSYELLEPDEQALFATLAVFIGGFTVEAAEEVADTNLAMLESLAETNLLRVTTTGRLGMLETVHEFASELLAARPDEDDLRRRHADWFCALAEAAEQHLISQDQREWLRRLDEESGNVRASLAFCFEGGDAVTGARIASALPRYWGIRSSTSEALEWLNRAMASSTAMPVSLRARMRWAAGYAAIGDGDHAHARPHFAESIRLAREARDLRIEAASLQQLAYLALTEGIDVDQAQSFAQRSLELARQVGDRLIASGALNILADRAWHTGQPEAALELYGESLDLRRELGDDRLVANSLLNLGHAEFARKRFARATELLEEGLTLAREAGDLWAASHALVELGRAQLFAEADERAAALFAEGLTVAAERGDVQVAAECLQGLAAVAGANGQAERAARLWGAAEVLLEAFDDADRSLDELVRPSLRTTLGEGFERELAAGRMLTLEDAVALGLESGASG